jgi:hypothetical protein
VANGRSLEEQEAERKRKDDEKSAVRVARQERLGHVEKKKRTAKKKEEKTEEPSE